MLSALKTLLSAFLLLAALPAWGSDELPQLPPSGPGDLPTLGAGPLSTTSMTDQTRTVTCFLGNPNDRHFLGSVATNPASAGASCNSLYYVCQGRCFGCYADYDLSEDICVDSVGRKFIR